MSQVICGIVRGAWSLADKSALDWFSGSCSDWVLRSAEAGTINAAISSNVKFVENWLLNSVATLYHWILLLREKHPERKPSSQRRWLWESGSVLWFWEGEVERQSWIQGGSWDGSGMISLWDLVAGVFGIGELRVARSRIFSTGEC